MSQEYDDKLEKPHVGEEESIKFWDAWKIPGVTSFALCLFFSKLIAYTFLYWLPYYINRTRIEVCLVNPTAVAAPRCYRLLWGAACPHSAQFLDCTMLDVHCQPCIPCCQDVHSQPFIMCGCLLCCIEMSHAANKSV